MYTIVYIWPEAPHGESDSAGLSAQAEFPIEARGTLSYHSAS